VRYLSVCSGIEAASVAWHRLGWSPVAFSEIEAFPSSVLAHRFPNVPNYGDMTAHATWPLQHGDIDILVGGTPCQSFSVAGLRKGLSDPRGGLMLTYLEIAQRLRPRWVVWENVPGVLSSGGGRDFGSFLGALGDLGYGWAYRVLDAQWVRTHGHPRAVPQRRRRVFVVGCLGDGTAAASVLFERESVCRDSPSRRTSREETPADAGGSASIGRWWDGGDCADTLTKCNANEAQRMPDKDNFGAVLQPVANTLGNRGLRSHTELDGHGAYIPAVAFTMGNLARGAGPSPSEEVFPTLKSGEGRGTDDQWPSVMTTMPPAVAFTSKDSGMDCGEISPILRAMTHTTSHPNGGGQVAVAQAMTVRRLTPRECERLQGFPDDWTQVPHRGKPAADGPRYKALGNSMAVNCMEWIGERIANYD
jgi:DNA (cytosine-5)-methyltransferase 1